MVYLVLFIINNNNNKKYIEDILQIHRNDTVWINFGRNMKLIFTDTE